KLIVLYLCRVKKGFQLNENNIRKLLTVRFCLGKLPVFIDFVHRLLTVAVWLVDPGIEKTGRETIRKSIVFICKRNVSKIGGYDSFIYRLIRYKHVDNAPEPNAKKR